MTSAKEYIDGVFTGVRAKPDLIGKTSVITAMSIDQPYAGRGTLLKLGIITGGDMNNDAVFDLYFPDKFAMERRNDPCSTYIGNKLQFTCQYMSYPSGYIKMVTMMKPCPQGCLAQNTYYYEVPIYNRADNMVINGEWRIVVRYPFIDVGTATLLN